ncbi:potassium/sodium hyperpolarization-activated cyclic nucleotide-gated channel 4 [Galendromus occidentalis]|uniref:Potassium/sodium hyperpolarization-activated cyclic nucleotide-gated channel 4 n=1 Tax=Galendromus occidentalis TaxID=34638 RepID=A0AAJ7SHN5_9ACAR|nr:potassium/sodium hyperpolarization-activated cyclic nucleotide-gated channel 4 [Galendromus occidentalis]
MAGGINIDQIERWDSEDLKTMSGSSDFQTPSSLLSSLYEYWFLPSQNSLSMKFFDSTTALMEEQHRQLQLGYSIIHPCSRFRSAWDIIIVIALSINALLLPVQLAFCVTENSTSWLFFSFSSTTIFAFDIVVNFYSGVIVANEIRLDRRYLAKKYLKGWFAVDFLGTVPFDRIVHLVELTNKALIKSATILGTPKLLRIVSLIRRVNEWQHIYVSTSNRIYFRIANIVVCIMFLAHFNGCLLYFVPMIQDFPRGSWVHSAGILGKNNYDKYIWSLYSALCQMITVGFGKVEVQTDDEIFLCFYVLVSGTVGYTVLLANVTTIVQNFEFTKTAHDKLMSEVCEYMEYKKLPQALRERVNDFLEKRYRGHYFNEQKILNQMSDVLRDDILSYSCQALVNKTPVFMNMGQHFKEEVIKRLRHEYFQPGDAIVRGGSVGSKMYLLESGNVSMALLDGTIIAHLRDGAFFGEICLFTVQESSRVSVIAETYCSLYSLSRSDFRSIIEDDIQAQSELARRFHSEQKLKNESVQSATDPLSGGKSNTKF